MSGHHGCRPGGGHPTRVDCAPPLGRPARPRERVVPTVWACTAWTRGQRPRRGRVAKAMRLLAWTQPRARGCRRGARASGATAPCPPHGVACATDGAKGGAAGRHPPPGPRARKSGPASCEGRGPTPVRRAVAALGAAENHSVSEPRPPAGRLCSHGRLLSLVSGEAPRPPRTAGRLLLCSSMQGIIPLA